MAFLPCTQSTIFITSLLLRVYIKNEWAEETTIALITLLISSLRPFFDYGTILKTVIRVNTFSRLRLPITY
jgi:hypothetical protein